MEGGGGEGGGKKREREFIYNVHVGHMNTSKPGITALLTSDPPWSSRVYQSRSAVSSPQ